MNEVKESLLKRFGITLLLFTLPALGADNWKTILTERLPLYGHRNWIVVADSAYPAQASEGIETIVSGADHFDVLKTVLAALGASKHVTPIIYTDQELKFLTDANAAGVSDYRRQFASMLGDRKINSLPHEQIISKLGQVSQSFRVLIIKSNLTIPYTSVFLQLDCAYWSAEDEARLRARMGKISK